MSKNKFELPTWEDADKHVAIGKENPLEAFIYQNEPIGNKEEAEFRSQLEKAIQYVIENVGSFGLTLHAPAGSVAGSETAKDVENDRPKANWKCPKCYLINAGDWPKCERCGTPSP